MKTVYDVQQLLKRFGCFVYFGDRKLEIEFMMEELKEIFLSNLIEKEQWIQAMSILQNELTNIKKK
ncbi:MULTISPECIES: YqgQ family protein [Bacillus]|uniref:YqgQ family protein n=1 Tax=Bacillus TaxID=1386 RepID=UPI0004790E62|nr:MULTISPECIES: YqgQ family protein [Bacillus]QHZ49135.1 YqgQ family protein [Bacillus sp. NSP9.1]WFA07494.1 YqgQ family protein [Bacillus sp. HSf4]